VTIVFAMPVEATDGASVPTDRSIIWTTILVGLTASIPDRRICDRVVDKTTQSLYNLCVDRIAAQTSRIAAIGGLV
jgi:hypothetical protein